MNYIVGSCLYTVSNMYSVACATNIQPYVYTKYMHPCLSPPFPSTLHPSLSLSPQARLDDWTEGGLSSKFMLSRLKQANEELRQYEEQAAPEGWTCSWDRSVAGGPRLFIFLLSLSLCLSIVTGPHHHHPCDCALPWQPNLRKVEFVHVLYV